MEGTTEGRKSMKKTGKILRKSITSILKPQRYFLHTLSPIPQRIPIIRYPLTHRAEAGRYYCGSGRREDRFYPGKHQIRLYLRRLVHGSGQVSELVTQKDKKAVKKQLKKAGNTRAKIKVGDIYS